MKWPAGIFSRKATQPASIHVSKSCIPQLVIYRTVTASCSEGQIGSALTSSPSCTNSRWSRDSLIPAIFLSFESRNLTWDLTSHLTRPRVKVSTSAAGGKLCLVTGRRADHTSLSPPPPPPPLFFLPALHRHEYFKVMVNRSPLTLTNYTFATLQDATIPMPCLV